MLWGFVVVTTSVTKVTKRKVSHQLIIKSEFLRNRVAAEGSKLKKSNQNAIKNCLYVTHDASFATFHLKPRPPLTPSNTRPKATKVFPPVWSRVKIVAGHGNI